MDVVLFVGAGFAEFIEFEGEREIALAGEVGKMGLDSGEEFVAYFFLLSFGAAGANFEIAVDEGVIGLAVGDAVIVELDGAGANAADGKDAALGYEDFIGFGEELGDVALRL